ERIIEFSNQIEQMLKDLSGQNPPTPVVIIALPRKILKVCNDPFMKDDKICLSTRTFQDLKRIAKMDEKDRPLFYDFHNYMKVLGYELKIPTQLMLPDTLLMKGGNLEDPASVAWNFVVAQYYKFSGIPWKLADLNPETVHVGISFYYDINKRDSVVIKAAIAQVYMRTGDSQVARGLELQVEHEEDIKRTNLTEEQAKDILSQTINLYKRQHHNNKPNRIVVHKKSEYTDEENEGFLKATQNIEIQDFIHIKEFCQFNAITSTDYPIARGSVFERNSNNKKVFNLYTTGYIPCLDTYPGSMIPKPIEVIVEKSNSDTEILARDVINLTKLDWNSTDFCKRMPVTLSVSKKVGKIMGELKGRDITPPTAYSNYM
ncbi:MAG: Piwi domain-containing protein, partial [Candidatus Thorarchaeota archaeon]